MIKQKKVTVKIFDLIYDDNNLPKLNIVKESSPQPALEYSDISTIINLLCELTHINRLTNEKQYALLFNQRCVFIGFVELATGNSKNTNASLKVCTTALALSGCHSFCIVHNHPSDDTLFPSINDLNEDYEREIAKILELHKFYNIIIGKTNWIFTYNPEVKYSIETGEESENEDWKFLIPDIKKIIKREIKKRKGKYYDSSK